MGFESLRENEEYPFFGENKVATPARVTSFNSVGGKVEPEISKGYLQDVGVGKQVDERNPELEVYLPNSYNVS